MTHNQYHSKLPWFRFNT